MAETKHGELPTVKEYAEEAMIPLRTVYHRIKTGKLKTVTGYDIQVRKTKVTCVKE